MDDLIWFFIILVALIAIGNNQREKELLEKIPKKERTKIIKEREKAQEKVRKDTYKALWWLLGISIAFILFLFFVAEASY